MEAYQEEMQALRETAQTEKIMPVVQKRAAHFLVQETPSKKLAPAFLEAGGGTWDVRLLIVQRLSRQLFIAPEESRR